MNKSNLLLLLCIIVFTFTSINADGSKKPDKSAEPAKKTANKKKAKKALKNRIIGAPIVFYSPETRMGFGAAGSYVFRIKKHSEKNRPSSFSPVFIYTLEKQFISSLNTELYFKDNKYQLKANIKFLKYPSFFYGIGPDTHLDDEEAYTPKGTDLFFSFLKRVGKNLSLGLQYHFYDWKLEELQAGGQLVGGELPGSTGGTISGFSLVALRDSRDSIFYPRSGDYFEFNSRFYLKALGSDFNFNTFTLNCRKYMPVFKSHIVAVQAMMQVQTGDVPFTSLAALGGQFLLRGYYEGRYRDKNLMVFQADYRAPLFWRIGVAGFVGLGSVARKFSDLTSGSLKYSYGAGLRFLFDKKENIWIRIDFAWGNDTSGFYFSIHEAF
ncbi:MAG: BamA/TamA family outer membrane protein [bacterium]|nr:BamA/TamA family outer membrane protein [bacterium]